MQTIDATGSRLTANLFISTYRMVRKLAPPRFLTLKVHPDVYKVIYSLADIPESIQLGETPGPLGKTIMRVNCVKPPMGVSDGVAIVQDEKADPTQLVFQIHGITELVLQNLKVSI